MTFVVCLLIAVASAVGLVVLLTRGPRGHREERERLRRTLTETPVRRRRR